MMIDQKQVELERPVEEKADTEKNLDEAAKVNYLERGDFVLFRTDSGALRLTLNSEKSFLRIKSRRCFPFSFSSKYVSVRDGNDEEIGIIRDLADLSKEYRRWIEDDLEMRYFTPRVKSISRIRYRFGGVEWYVTTDRGAKKIITKSVHDTMTEVEPGRYIITDVDGNRYELFARELDEASRTRLNRLV